MKRKKRKTKPLAGEPARRAVDGVEFITGYDYDKTAPGSAAGGIVPGGGSVSGFLTSDPLMILKPAEVAAEIRRMLQRPPGGPPAVMLVAARGYEPGILDFAASVVAGVEAGGVPALRSIRCAAGDLRFRFEPRDLDAADRWGRLFVRLGQILDGVER